MSRRKRAWNVRPGDVLPWLNLKTRRENRFEVVSNDSVTYGVTTLRLRRLGKRRDSFVWRMKRNSLVVVEP